MYFPVEYDKGDDWGSAESFKQRATLNDLVYKVDFLIEENQKNKNVIRALLRKNGIELEEF